MSEFEATIDLIYKSDAKGIKQKIKEFPDLIDRTDEHGGSLLHRAAINGETKIAEVLLDMGANVNLRDWKRATPLHFAASNPRFLEDSGLNSSLVTELLLERGGKLELRDNYWDTPLLVAVNHSNLSVVKVLLSQGADIYIQNRQRLDALGMAHFVLEAIEGKDDYDEQRIEVHQIIDLLTKHRVALLRD